MSPDWHRARAEDVDFLRTLFVAVRLPEFLAGGLPETGARTLLEQQHRIRERAYAAAHPDLEVWLLTRDDAPVGALQLAIAADALQLVDFAILPAQQGRGLGRAALEALQSRAVRAGLPIRLCVRRDNPARRLYARLGFVEQPAAPDTLDLDLFWSP